MKTCLHPLLAAVIAAVAALAEADAPARTPEQGAALVSLEQVEPSKALLSAPQIAPQQLAEGERYYFNSCAHCHGNDARGDDGPDLHGLEISDRRIAAVIKYGIKGEMPSFAKKHDDTQILCIIAYLRTLK